ncbi:recombinase family protein [Geomonas paludis]|uniref:Recombinase family protein n=1 Tax=Geomonas paludis TaxID=2740185 RepID=A0ABY4L956_9BACT|nr:recombinase family protein [Geomonas paludis]UPU34494.1 recombinase family protein [Geomonas paludis]
MCVYGYIRVSTDKQDYDNQKYGVLNFANINGHGHVELIEETVSGRVSWRKRELGALVDRMKIGDVLIISELSRLGRSLLEVMELLAELMRRKVIVHSVKEGYKLGNDLQSKILAFAFTLAAEIESAMIKARTTEALAKKKAEGVRLGRPLGRIGKSKLDGKEEEIKRLLKLRVPKSAIARMLEVSRPALYDFIASRKIEQNITEK